MLDTLRAFAFERLDEDDVEELRRRQFALVRAAADRHRLDLDDLELRAWLDEIELLLPDIRVALA